MIFYLFVLMRFYCIYILNFDLIEMNYMFRRILFDLLLFKLSIYTKKNKF